jgi:putative ABC transport system ATP-binding protein
MEMMAELAHGRGRVVVVVTHDSRVLHFADRTVRIEDGLIAKTELPERIPPAGILQNGLQQSTVNFA